MASYQERQAEFVSNLTGTSFAEVALVSLQLPLSVLLVPCLMPLLWPAALTAGNRLPPATAARLTAVLEFSVVILPVIAVLTVAADHAAQLCTALAACAALSVCALIGSTRRLPSLTDALRQVTVATARLPCITNARAHLHLVTVAAILAVDFRAFPRRLAKAETFGAGLMDMAVGSYVISHGLTSPSARAAGPRRPLYDRLAVYRRTARRAAVLAALGALRLLLVKVSGYHEHESEYGRHGNFFFTLAEVKLVGEFWLLVIPPGLAAPAAVLLTLLQNHLLAGGLQHWVVSNPPRDSLLEANRESLVSLMGFLALYFCGVALGRHLARERRGWLRWLACLAEIALTASGLWRLAAGMNAATLPVSRRLCNATYIVASAACCFGGTAAYLAVDLLVTLLSSLKITPAVRVPRLMSAASEQGLSLFCLANLATGAVNLSMRTIDADDATALAVVTAYMAALMAIVVWLDTRGMAKPAGKTAPGEGSGDGHEKAVSGEPGKKEAGDEARERAAPGVGQDKGVTKERGK